MNKSFDKYIEFDCSGARTLTVSLKGLRVYLVEDDGRPFEESPPRSPRIDWTRSLAGFLRLRITPSERNLALAEGWVLGVA